MPADHHTILKAQAQMQRCVKKLEALANDVADARTIKEFNSDRLKRALSVTVAEFLATGESGVAAEHKARASAVYGAQLHDLMEQYKTAMRVIEQHSALQAMFDSSRSLLSTEKAKLGLL